MSGFGQFECCKVKRWRSSSSPFLRPVNRWDFHPAYTAPAHSRKSLSETCGGSGWSWRTGRRACRPSAPRFWKFLVICLDRVLRNLAQFHLPKAREIMRVVQVEIRPVGRGLLDGRSLIQLKPRHKRIFNSVSASDGCSSRAASSASRWRCASRSFSMSAMRFCSSKYFSFRSIPSARVLPLKDFRFGPPSGSMPIEIW